MERAATTHGQESEAAGGFVIECRVTLAVTNRNLTIVTQSEIGRIANSMERAALLSAQSSEIHIDEISVTVRVPNGR